VALLLERDGELAQLGAAFERARDGSGGLVLLGGEAGAGKTALVRAFEAAAGVSVLWSRCEPLSVPIALAPVRELAGGRAEDDRPALAAALRERLRAAPAVLVLEDLHWTDTATLDVVRLLAGWIERLHGLAIATYRDDELEIRPELRLLVGDFVGEPAVERLALAPLSPAAASPAACSAARGRSSRSGTS
jgi:predicted ATPase